MPPELADAEGFVGVGGDLAPSTLLQAYREGVFPWFNEGDPILWWSPDPRTIIELHSTNAQDSGYGGLHVLYNCAGGSIVQDTLVTEVDMSVWGHTISLDLLGMFHCSRHGIPQIIKSGGGSVVNMSSVAALMGFTPAHVYVAAKGGIISLTKAMACEYAEDRVRVNVVCPGVCDTPMMHRNIEGPSAYTTREALLKEMIRGGFREQPPD